jgi:hypothetical protein
MDFH